MLLLLLQDFLHSKLYHLQTKTVLFLPSQSEYLLFPFLMALARTSSTMLNRSGKRGHLCLVSDLRGKISSFSLLRMMLAVSLCIDVLYQVEEVPLHS